MKAEPVRDLQQEPCLAETSFLTSFLAELSSSACLVLRNYDDLPASVGNDLDILIDGGQREVGQRILIESANTHGYTLINYAEFSPFSLFVANYQTGHQVHIDLFTGLKWRGFDILWPDVVLVQRQDKGLFFVPHPVHEATLNLLTRLLYHGYVKEKYKPGVLAAYRSDPQMAEQALAEPFGAQAASELVKCVLSEDWASVEAATNRWRRLLVTRKLTRYPRRALASIFTDAKRLARRFWAPPGLMLVMLGPDGCGKSSVAAGVMDALAPTFGKHESSHIHWKPVLFRLGRADAGPVTDPHGKPPRGRLASIAYFTFHWLEFVLGAQVRLRPALFRNGLVVIDRYYHDFFVDPQRYRLAVPKRLLRWAFRFVMKPDLLICLDAPHEVLQGRKQEVTPEVTARQRQAYLDLARTLPNSHVVDAARPLDEVVAEAEAIVLRYIATRTARRLGLDEV